MSLVRWEPFSEIDSLHKEMNSLFNRIIPNYISDNSLSFIPAAEIQETPEAIDVKLEIPGMDAKDIDIQVSANHVSISGERKEEIKTEFRYGSFTRLIPLPARVKNNNVSAEYKDGILHLNMPKAEEEKNKILQVNIS